jgi:hypothetical protein
MTLATARSASTSTVARAQRWRRERSCKMGLAQSLQAMASKLIEASTQQALTTMLQQISQSIQTLSNENNQTETIMLMTMMMGTGEQVQQALAPILQQIGRTTDSRALQALAQSLQALATKLTEAQAQQALAPVLQQIRKTTDSRALRALAQGLQALAAKLSDSQAQQALTVAKSALAWTAEKEEAADWARAIVALLPHTADQDGARVLVAAIAYPTAAGPATEVLLEAIRARHSDAPPKEAGTEASLAWIAEKYPDVLRPSVCPPPPQPTSLSGLKCPIVEANIPASSAASAPRGTKGATTN